MQIKEIDHANERDRFQNQIVDNLTLFELFEYDSFRFENESLESNHDSIQFEFE